MTSKRKYTRVLRDWSRKRIKNRQMPKLSKPVRHEWDIADIYELDVNNPDDMRRLREVYMKTEIQNKYLFPSVDAELNRYVVYTPMILVQNVPQYAIQLLSKDVPWTMEGKLWKVSVSVAENPPFKEEYATRLVMRVDDIPVYPEYFGELIGSVQTPLTFDWMPKRYTAYHNFEIVGDFLQTDSPADVIFEVRTEIYYWVQKQSTKSLEQQTFE